MDTKMEIAKEKYKPKTFDFRARSRFKPQKDGTVKIICLSAGYIDPRDRIILDPF